ncbi:MAG: IS5 family transposase [Proteobacteria bacterium]|nr:IS5 family transposase [Pseudomonadota bacterium]
MTDKFITKGFADYIIESRGYHNTFLEKVDRLIDWESIEKVLKKKYKKTASADRRPAYPALPMFKLLLLQRWNGLSDPQAEAMLRDRISFILFTGFSLTSPLPDHSTICRFRNNLLELNLYEKLFDDINTQIESRGLIVKKGMIVDATIIESSRRPRKVINIMPEDRKEEETDMSSAITYSDDSDAAWIKKGNRPYYGYKGHISVDAEEGFITGGHITPANISDTTEFEKLVNGSPKGSVILADKGYASEKNRTVLANKKLKDGIMYKAARNKPLTHTQRIINRFISSVRYKVEQSIGTLKRGYHFFRMRYIGLKKGNMEFLLNAMAFNLKKAAAMIE